MANIWKGAKVSGNLVDDPRIKDILQPPKRQPPSIAQLMRWDADGGCEATDGCWVEPDGTCPHGKPSWLLVMGMI